MERGCAAVCPGPRRLPLAPAALVQPGGRSGVSAKPRTPRFSVLPNVWGRSRRGGRRSQGLPVSGRGPAAPEPGPGRRARGWGGRPPETARKRASPRRTWPARAQAPGPEQQGPLRPPLSLCLSGLSPASDLCGGLRGPRGKNGLEAAGSRGLPLERKEREPGLRGRAEGRRDERDSGRVCGPRRRLPRRSARPAACGPPGRGSDPCARQGRRGRAGGGRGAGLRARGSGSPILPGGRRSTPATPAPPSGRPAASSGRSGGLAPRTRLPPAPPRAPPRGRWSSPGRRGAQLPAPAPSHCGGPGGRARWQRGAGAGARPPRGLPPSGARGSLEASGSPRRPGETDTGFALAHAPWVSGTCGAHTGARDVPAWSLSEQWDAADGNAREAAGPRRMPGPCRARSPSAASGPLGFGGKSQSWVAASSQKRWAPESPWGRTDAALGDSGSNAHSAARLPWGAGKKVF